MTAPTNDLHVVGVGSGPSVLFLGGLGAASGAWREVWAHLRDHRCVAFDPPGTGRSAAVVGGASVAGVADAAAQVAEGLDSPLVVVGYSFGGAVAQELARRRPDLVDGLVLAATSVGIGSVPGVVPAVLASRRWPTGRAAVDQALSFLQWSSLPWLHRVRAPTWVVAGALDLVVPPANGWMLASLLPSARLRLVPTGHDGVVDRAAPSLAAVVREACAVVGIEADCAPAR